MCVCESVYMQLENSVKEKKKEIGNRQLFVEYKTKHRSEEE